MFPGEREVRELTQPISPLSQKTDGGLGCGDLPDGQATGLLQAVQPGEILPTSL